MASQEVGGYDRPVSPLSINKPASPPSTIANELTTQVTVTYNLLPKNAVDEEGEQAEIPTYCRTSKAAFVDIVIVTAIAAVTMCVSSGLIFNIKLNTRNGFTQSKPIGDRFSLFRAKLIDVGCSIMIAPGLLALANGYVFKLVRLCAMSQETVGDRPVNLKALTELTGTDWGSYSLPKH